MQTTLNGYDSDALSLLDRLQNLTSTEAVLDAAMGEFGRYGFESIVLSAPRDPRKRIEKIAFGRMLPARLTQSYSDWCRDYWDKRYIDFDPVVHRMRRDWRPFDWRELSVDGDREPRALEIMRRRMNSFDDGFVVPIFDLNGLTGFVSLTGDGVNLSARNKSVIHLISIYVFHHVRALRVVANREKGRLTLREREVLSWVARGKTAWDIGEILDIAKRTVDAHVQTACKKLRAVNRAQAVAVAIQERQIQL